MFVLKREIFVIDKDLASSSDIHIHVPAGATPKDGPSAVLRLQQRWFLLSQEEL